MEEIYESSYWTVIATSVTDLEGFLHRDPKNSMRLVDTDLGIAAYMCKESANFHKDMKQGALNQRG